MADIDSLISAVETYLAATEDQQEQARADLQAALDSYIDERIGRVLIDVLTWRTQWKEQRSREPQP